MLEVFAAGLTRPGSLTADIHEIPYSASYHPHPLKKKLVLSFSLRLDGGATSLCWSYCPDCLTLVTKNVSPLLGWLHLGSGLGSEFYPACSPINACMVLYGIAFAWLERV